MELKPFANDDLSKCTHTFLDVFNQEPWNDAWTIESATQYLLDYINTPGFIGVIAEDENEVIGFIFGVRKRWWSGDEFFINEMCVSIEKQKLGVGSKLLKFLEKDLKSSGVSNTTLLTNRGIPAESFYKKNGFTEIDRLVFLSKDLE